MWVFRRMYAIKIVPAGYRELKTTAISNRVNRVAATNRAFANGSRTPAMMI
jgi:hypothetical protein